VQGVAEGGGGKGVEGGAEGAWGAGLLTAEVVLERPARGRTP